MDQLLTRVMDAENQMLVTITVKELRQIIAEEVRAALQNTGALVSDKDKLLEPKKAAELMGVTPRWQYRHADKLPFTRRISRKHLRFSEAGLRRWLAAKKPDVRS